jgi:allantoate deiminase
MVNTGGARAIARCNALGVAPYSDSGAGLYRSYLSEGYIAAQKAVAGWMSDAGMIARVDAAGNLIGRYDGKEAGPALLIGSHLDSVRDAGQYDGPLGIMLGIELVDRLHRIGMRTPFPIDVIAFGDEEGSRFPAAMLTSRAVAGTLELPLSDSKDANGVSLSDALANYARKARAFADVPTAMSIEDFPSAKRDATLAYFEAHIEQGPVLEAEGLAVGVVTAIAAQRRYLITVTGQAGHAGTTHMVLRRDALAGAAAMMLKAEEVALSGPPDLVATVGKLEVGPGAANVVPGKVDFTLDVRAGTNEVRDAAAATILQRFAVIAAQRKLALDISLLQDLAASPCAPDLIARLGRAIGAIGLPVRKLVSGAGHDAMIVAAHCPTVMLFVRCRGGISHNPAEHAAPEDAEVALNVMEKFVLDLAQ